MKNALLLILLFSSITSLSQEKNFIDQNYIQVVGTARKEVVPDQIYLQVFINEKDNKAKETLEQLESKMIKKLQELGIDVQKQLSIKDVASNFKFYFLMKTDIFSTKEYEILVHDATTAGKVIVGLESLGISNISINKVDHSRIDELKLEVKALAISNAKVKAQTLTTALGQKVGRAIHIEEVADEQPIMYDKRDDAFRFRGYMATGAVSRAAPAEPEINFEAITLDSEIRVKFVLE